MLFRSNKSKTYNKNTTRLQKNKKKLNNKALNNNKDYKIPYLTSSKIKILDLIHKNCSKMSLQVNNQYIGESSFENCIE